MITRVRCALYFKKTLPESRERSELKIQMGVDCIIKEVSIELLIILQF
jgi:hypothetical protein